MGKSLTETAKAILMKEEGAYPSVSPMGAGSPERDVNSTTPAKSSLKPGSPEGQVVNPGANSTTGNQAQDLGAALVKNTDVPPSAKAAGSLKKDSSKSAKSSVSAEPAKKQAEVMEEEEEVTGEVVTEEEINEEDDIELSEELVEFIDAMIAEGASEEEIATAIEENFEFVSEEVEQIDEAKVPESHKKAMLKTYGAGRVTISDGQIHHKDKYGETNSHKYDPSKNQPIGRHVGTITVQMEESVLEDYEVNMAEDVEALFAGEELSEEFKSKATTIFEAAVKRKIEEELAAIEEAYAATLEEQIASIQEELSSNVDDYLNYVVEQWMSENEVAVEAGLRTELTEDFISGLKALFEEHYIDIPEDKVSVVEELGNKVSDLEAKLNEQIEISVQLNKMLSESRKVEVLNQMVEGLTATQADKLKTLAEGVSYDNIEEYTQKVATLKESYFPTSSINAPRELDSIEAGTEGKSMIAEELNGPMAHYVRALGKTLPK